MSSGFWMGITQLTSWFCGSCTEFLNAVRHSTSLCKTPNATCNKQEMMAKAKITPAMVHVAMADEHHISFTSSTLQFSHIHPCSLCFFGVHTCEARNRHSHFKAVLLSSCRSKPISWNLLCVSFLCSLILS